MMIKRAFILLLCFWLPLQASAGMLMGCDVVGHVMIKQSSSNFVMNMSGHHCDDMATDTVVKPQPKSPHNDCNYCKTHCSGTSLVFLSSGLLTPNITQEKFFIDHSQSHTSVYLDQPQRPPQIFS